MLLLLLVIQRSSMAQSGEGPTLVLQPGLMSFDVVSAPEGVRSRTGFNFRFAARVPTSQWWLTPIIGASVLPYGTSGVTDRNANAPSLFAGNVFPVVEPERTGGWLSLEAPLLIYHRLGGGGEQNPRAFGRDFFIQLSAFVHIGRKIFGEFGPRWSQMDAYAFLEQNLTPNRNTTTGQKDRFNPVVLLGISVPIGAPVTDQR